MKKMVECPDTVDIHPTALVSPQARLGKHVRIGPWCSVGPDVVCGDHVTLHASVIIDGKTSLGSHAEIYPFTTIGLAPQDLKYAGEPTSCEIGDNTIIRENVTIHRGTAQGLGITKIGSDCLIMANAHVAHDCCIGNHVIIVNNVVMGGHVRIGDYARIMGSSALHQFVRIGRGAVVGGVCGVEMDVIPYGSVLGNRARLVGLNWVGLKRSGIPVKDQQMMRRAFRMLYPRNKKDASSLVLRERIEEVQRIYAENPYITEIVDFMLAPSVRGLTRAEKVSFMPEEETALA